MRMRSICYFGRLWRAFAVGSVLGVLFGMLAGVAGAQTPSSTPCLSTEDVKAFRQALADRDFYKQRAEAAEAQRDAAVQSRENWKALFESEKRRADEIQGGRIGELQKALDLAKTQMDADRQKIGEQNAQIISLKAGRKWWFAAGAALGGVGGFFVGKNVNQIRTFVLPEQTQSRGFTLRF